VLSKDGEKNRSVFAIPGKYPVAFGPLLILPIRHGSDIFSMTEAERHVADELVRVLQGKIRADDNQVVGSRWGTNCGKAAGQKIDHATSISYPAGRVICPTGEGEFGV
jgi:diadenosine tetraphosphate (Ap4A) HIT family hydrolase